MPYKVKITQKSIKDNGDGTKTVSCYCNGFPIENTGNKAEDHVKNTCRAMKAFGISSNLELQQFLRESPKKVKEAIRMIDLPEWDEKLDSTLSL